jgi:hypothetical protein
MSAAAVPSMFAITIELILNALLLDAGLEANCVALVPTATESELPMMLVTLTIFGAAMMTPYSPKIIEKAIA